MKIIIVSIGVLLISACCGSSDAYILVTECPEEDREDLQEYYEVCVAANRNRCSAEAKALFCEKRYIRNPNVKLDGGYNG